MTRVISGVARGRRLAVPAGRGTRPTSDRAREALFSTLESLRGGLTGARVLDLYAGSGAVGLEAASRGAAQVVLVESDPTAAGVAEQNVRTVGQPAVTVRRTPVRSLLGAGRPAEQAPFDLVYCDPPYATDSAEVTAVLGALATGGWLAAGGLVVVERAGRDGELAWPAGYEPLQSRRYGEATLWYGRAPGS